MSTWHVPTPCPPAMGRVVLWNVPLGRCRGACTCSWARVVLSFMRRASAVRIVPLSAMSSSCEERAGLINEGEHGKLCVSPGVHARMRTSVEPASARTRMQ